MFPSMAIPGYESEHNLFRKNKSPVLPLIHDRGRIASPAGVSRENRQGTWKLDYFHAPLLFHYSSLFTVCPPVFFNFLKFFDKCVKKSFLYNMQNERKFSWLNTSRPDVNRIHSTPPFVNSFLKLLHIFVIKREIVKYSHFQQKLFTAAEFILSSRYRHRPNQC